MAKLKLIEGGRQGVQTISDNELRKRAKELKGKIDSHQFELAGILVRVVETNLFQEWGYKIWQGYVENELDIHPRKAQYLMKNWVWFVRDLAEHPEVRAKIEESGLGWTKVSKLAGVVDETNVDEWVDRAKRLTRRELEETVRNAREGKGDPEVTLRTVTFKLYPPQADNVEQALEIAEKVAESDKRGHLLDLICTSYLTETVFQTEYTDKLMIHYVKKIGDILGLDIVAFDKKSKEMVMGADDLEAFMQRMTED